MSSQSQPAYHRDGVEMVISKISSVGQFRRGSRLAALAMLLTLGSFSAALADGPGEVEYLLKSPLIRAGIPINRDSLIKALNDQRILIAGNAALLLARFPRTNESVRALSAVVADDKDVRREIVSVNAARSLVQLGERQWAAIGKARLAKMQDRVAQVQLAGLLARIGHADGWPVVLSTLYDPELALVAIENISYFDGLRSPAGRQINLTHELQSILPKLPEASRQLVEAQLLQLRKKTTH
ncbi:MAG TPA: hypothetical protein VGO68_17695 [Pyrinomonadaceae bacterium]|nr:hypothetical protein [Pyrinomonadaceae bacterium]